MICSSTPTELTVQFRISAFALWHRRKAYDCGHDGCELHCGTSFQSEERSERTQSHECPVLQPERLHRAREVCLCTTTSSSGGDQAGIGGSEETVCVGPRSRLVPLSCKTRDHSPSQCYSRREKPSRKNRRIKIEARARWNRTSRTTAAIPVCRGNWVTVMRTLS
jgi:hypothetical protein